MERVVVVGNCQAKVLEMLLSTNTEFAARFDFVSFPPVHELPTELVPELHRAVADAAVVILQKIDDGYRDGLGLGTSQLAGLAGDRPVIRWPSVYWAGYVPDLFYLRDAVGGVVVDGPFDYHDRSILDAYAAGLGVAGACDQLEDAERPSGAPAWAANSTAELAIRGEGCDIQVGAFIASHFRDELLFFTMNHPANRVLAQIAEEIAQTLGISGGVDPQRMPGEPLGSTFYPLHANHVRALELEFGADVAAGRAPFRIRGVTYTAAEAVRAFFDYYDANPELVSVNVGDPGPAGT